MKRSSIYTVLLLCLSFSAWAQSDFDLSQRWFNQSIYNPAATGSCLSSGIFLHARQQWAGMEGAPVTGVVSANGYLPAVKSGIGISINADRIGFTNTYNARLAYAFHIPLSEESVLSLGLSAGVINRHINSNGALVDNLNDPVLYAGNLSEYTPDFDCGLEYQGYIKLGAAVRHIGTKLSKHNVAENPTHLWAYASTHINAVNNLTFEPIVSYVIRNDINRFEVGLITHILKYRSSRESNNIGWVGAMYRLNKQYSVMAGIYITDQLKAGYSFDYGIGPLSKISMYGTHEIMIAWEFKSLFQKDCPCAAYGKSEKMLRKGRGY